MSILKGERTLGDLRRSHSTKASFNKAMRMDAKKRCEDIHPEWRCKICGDNREIDVCHIKSISEYDDNLKIKEINGPNNTVLLCPLHHRLFDQKRINEDRLKDQSIYGLGIHIIIDFKSSMGMEISQSIIDKMKKNIISYIYNNSEINTSLKENNIWIDDCNI